MSGFESNPSVTPMVETSSTQETELDDHQLGRLKDVRDRPPIALRSRKPRRGGLDGVARCSQNAS
jgi:hypothetical protein